MPLDATRSRLAETDAELQSLKKSQTETAPEQTGKKTISKLQLQLEQLRQALADKDIQHKATEDIVSELKNENRVLQEKITTAEQEKTNTEDITSVLEKNNKDLETQKERIAILENQGVDLRSELDRRETEYFRMQDEYTSLQDRFDSLLRERDTLFPYTLDSDNDTISDAKDTCPGTVQGAAVGPDGCEIDSDRDGVVDRLDLCPDAPGATNINLFGCEEGEPIFLSGIFFSGGNAELSPASQSYLDNVAGVLKLYGDSRFEVAGHTDSIGEPARNLIVSELRAESVRDYLVNKGIEADRLVPVGHGSEQPVADNATPEGRAANRRVELRIIAKGENKTATEGNEPVTTAEEEDSPIR